MLNKTIVRLLVIALAAGLTVTGLTACDTPEEGEDPVAEQEVEAPEAPDEDPGAEGPDLEGADGDGEIAIDGPDDGQPPMAMQGQDQGGEVSDEQLDNFGEAIEAVQELEEEGDDPEARMQEADSQEEMQQIQQELIGEIQGAVEDAGMEFGEFMMLSQRIQQDPELQQRLSERVDMEELMGPAPQQQPQPGAQQPGGQQPGGAMPEGGDDAPTLE